MALRASPKSSSEESARSGSKQVMPALAVTASDRPPTVGAVVRIACSSRSALAVGASGGAAPVSTRKQSPPIRPATSPALIVASSVRPTWASASSPTAVP